MQGPHGPPQPIAILELTDGLPCRNVWLTAAATLIDFNLIHTAIIFEPTAP